MIVSLVSRQCDLFSVAFFGIPQAEETRQGPYMPLIIHHWSVMLCPVSGITCVGMQKVTIFNWAADQGIDWTAFTSSNELVWADGEGSAWKLGVNQDGSDDIEIQSASLQQSTYFKSLQHSFLDSYIYYLGLGYLARIDNGSSSPDLTIQKLRMGFRLQISILISGSASMKMQITFKKRTRTREKIMASKKKFGLGNDQLNFCLSACSIVTLSNGASPLIQV